MSHATLVFESAPHAGRELSRRGTLACALAIATVFTADVLTPLGISFAFLYVPILWAALLWANHRQVLVAAAACTALTMVGPEFGWDGDLRVDIINRSIVLAAATNGSVANPLSGLPLRTVLTTSARQTATVALRPWKKLQVRTTWFQLDQSLAERLRTDSDFLDVSVLYRFRLLDFEVGYTLYDENVIGLDGVSRRSFFFRVRRSFRIF